MTSRRVVADSWRIRERWGAAPAAHGIVVCVVLAAAVAAAAPERSGAELEAEKPQASAADRVTASIADETLRALVAEVLDRNPTVASLEARARAAEQKGAQAGSLPDPQLTGMGFVAQPQTRVGPQVLQASLSQRLPWFGKLKLSRRAADEAAAAMRADVSARRLELVTETRRAYYELAFLDEQRTIVQTDKETLLHFEELARTRYASGLSHEQGVVKIDAEITKADNRLLDIQTRHATLAAWINALRDRPQDAAIPTPQPPALGPALGLDPSALRAQALSQRPDLHRADRDIARSDALVELAHKAFMPDLSVGATWTSVGQRTDPAGVASPPPDNGHDSLGVSLSLNLPMHRRRLAAGLTEAEEQRLAAVAHKRGVVAAIDRDLADLRERERLTGEQAHLFDDVLIIQAEQSLRSAEAGYAAGALNSLDLLDAERTLLDVRISAARARADHAIALARLEGAVGVPLAETKGAE
jgi:cobalt-zinc-cadmium efflux system outer membrane protein